MTVDSKFVRDGLRSLADKVSAKIQKDLKRLRERIAESKSHLDKLYVGAEDPQAEIARAREAQKRQEAASKLVRK